MYRFRHDIFFLGGYNMHEIKKVLSNTRRSCQTINITHLFEVLSLSLHHRPLKLVFKNTQGVYLRTV